MATGMGELVLELVLQLPDLLSLNPDSPRNRPSPMLLLSQFTSADLSREFPFDIKQQVSVHYQSLSSAPTSQIVALRQQLQALYCVLIPLLSGLSSLWCPSFPFITTLPAFFFFFFWFLCKKKERKLYTLLSTRNQEEAVSQAMVEY